MESKYEPSPEGVVLRALREAADLPQSEVSKMLDKSRGYWTSVEVGLCRVTPDTIRTFCALLDLPRSMEERLLKLRETPWKQPNRRSRKSRVTIGKPKVSKLMPPLKRTKATPDAT